MRDLTQDLSYAARGLARAPGFTAVAVLTLALGIGANTAMFSVANVVFLHPLPYERPGQLVLVTTVGRGGNAGGAQPADFLDWRAQNHVFDSMAAKIDWTSYKLTDRNDPVEVVGSPVSAAFLPLLRVQPVVGRVFLETEDQPGAPGVALISEQLWETRYRRDPRILERSVTINGKPLAVVGVMPADFALHDTRGKMRDQLWIPLAQQFDARGLAVRDDTYQLRVWARLKPEVTIEQAQAEMDVIAQRLERQYPKTNTGRRVRLVKMEEALIARLNPQARLLVRVLLGAVGFVLGIACANVANLLLARAVARRQEIAIRMALGAGKGRIARLLLTESLLLSALGGLAGLLLASWGVRLLPALAPANLPLPRLDQLRIDGYVIAFTACLSIATALLFGSAPAIQTARRDIHEALKQHGAAASRRQWMRSALVVAEVALSYVLLIGAALLVTTFFRLLQTNPGIATEHVLTLRVPAPDREMERFERRPFYNELLRRVEAMPGIRSAALVNSLPFTGGEWLQKYRATAVVRATTRRVTPGYFQALGIALRAGRVFSEGDGAASAPVVVINETMARQYWSPENPVGKQLREASEHDRVLPDGAVATIVGVVADVKQRLDSDPVPEVYFPFSQTGNYTLGTTLIVRTGGAAVAVGPAIRDEVHALDPVQPVMEMAVLDEILSRSIAPQRFNLIVLGVFAAIGLALACAGIYSVIALSVSQRTREFGIRMALGADWSDVGGLVVRQGVTAALIGVTVGAAGALGLTRIITSQLYGVSPTDPPTFVVVSLLTIGLAAAASFIPARRAALLDPVVALRHE